MSKPEESSKSEEIGKDEGQEVDLRREKISGANLTQATLNVAILQRANFSRAELTGANFSDEDLSQIDLTGATLSEASLNAANLNAANLEKVDLKKIGSTEGSSQPPSIALSITVNENSDSEKVAKHLAELCSALNALHISCGGDGLVIDEWDLLVDSRVTVGAK